MGAGTNKRIPASLVDMSQSHKVNAGIYQNEPPLLFAISAYIDSRIELEIEECGFTGFLNCPLRDQDVDFLLIKKVKERAHKIQRQDMILECINGKSPVGKRHSE